MDIEGLEELLKQIGKNVEDFDKNAKTVTDKIGMKVIKEAKLKTPTDTGVLIRSWQIKRNDDTEVVVFNNVHYGPHIEYGHRFGKTNRVYDGKYMLTKAVEIAEEEFENELETMIENLWK